ncbi:GNAT family N-acetyltransferase [Streptomyces marianii]|uniref:GNAT family N-acetyltransferase n=1 Tax=Streptomyces marianii TaxID=1817406 RepID=A0A5R9EL33_9ACTN|nr:GNAT family N-acetyltransferase [Streptomyces marianii]
MADFSVKPILTGAKVVLRPFSEEDAPTMAAILRDTEVLLLTGSAGAPPFPDEQLRSWYATRGDQPDRLDVGVVDRASGELVGEAVLNNWDERNRSCNFRILIGPRGRDRGLGTEAVRLITGYGFERLGLNRISLSVYDFNPRARRAYEKAGFIAEGTEREVLRHEDGWVDATNMSVLAREWAVHRGRPED